MEQEIITSLEGDTYMQTNDSMGNIISSVNLTKIYNDEYSNIMSILKSSPVRDAVAYCINDNVKLDIITYILMKQSKYIDAVYTSMIDVYKYSQTPYDDIQVRLDRTARYIGYI